MYVRSVKFLLAWGSVFCGGCVTNSPRPFFNRHQSRNTEAARSANERGLALVANDKIDEAEKAFRESIRCDLKFEAAHNNLGLVLLQKQQFYEAAIEFRIAAKLNPDAVEPLKNLAVLYESIGWTKQAQRQSIEINLLTK